MLNVYNSYTHYTNVLNDNTVNISIENQRAKRSLFCFMLVPFMKFQYDEYVHENCVLLY